MIQGLGGNLSVLSLDTKLTQLEAFVGKIVGVYGYLTNWTLWVLD